MGLNQRFNREIRKHIAIVKNKCLIPEKVVGVFDSSAGFEQDWLMAEAEFISTVVCSISIAAEDPLIGFRAMVLVDDKAAHARIDQVVKGECRERLVENRDKRFR